MGTRIKFLYNNYYVVQMAGIITSYIMFNVFHSLLTLTFSDHCVLLPLNQMMGMGFGILCRVLTTKESLMGWNKSLASEYSELDAYKWETELKSYSFVLKPQLSLCRRPTVRKGHVTNRLNLELCIHSHPKESLTITSSTIQNGENFQVNILTWCNTQQ